MVGLLGCLLGWLLGAQHGYLVRLFKRNVAGGSLLLLLLLLLMMVMLLMLRLRLSWSLSLSLVLSSSWFWLWLLLLVVAGCCLPLRLCNAKTHDSSRSARLCSMTTHDSSPTAKSTTPAVCSSRTRHSSHHTAAGAKRCLVGAQ